ncbi:hypothetical protein [Virgisporangium aliadipatigenens]|nr:hypothetical protein [Virgisporangium aliadipatigenens]
MSAVWCPVVSADIDRTCRTVDMSHSGHNDRVSIPHEPAGQLKTTLVDVSAARLA